MEGRSQSKVKRVIGRIAIDDQFLTGQRNLPASIAHLKESAGFGQITEMEMVGAGPFRLEGRSWRRKQLVASWHRIRNIQLGVQNITRRVFKDGGHGKI